MVRGWKWRDIEQKEKGLTDMGKSVVIVRWVDGVKEVNGNGKIQ